MTKKKMVVRQSIELHVRMNQKYLSWAFIECVGLEEMSPCLLQTPVPCGDGRPHEDQRLQQFFFMYANV